MKDELWDEVLLKIKDKIPKESYEIWLKPIKPINISGNILEMGVPNMFFKNWMNTHFRSFLDDHLKKITNNLMSIDFIISSEVVISQRYKTEEGIEVKKEKKYSIADFYLNPKYTFDSFVIGESNRFAYAACQAVADKPGMSYNPLFIYGGVGLGKTHLVHAIGQQILQKKSNVKIVYISSEQFLNEFVDAIRFNKPQRFKDKYRSIDVLLIDDIQFLAGKEGIQEEFFHTFNTLHGSGKQIVLTSDRPPKEIKTLEERLRSRLEGGLIVDIQFPCIETRMAIIKKKAEKEGILIPDDVCSFIASKIKTNIRELEGALIRIIAYISLTHEKLDINMVKRILKNTLIFDEQPESISIEFIQRKTSKYFKVQLSDILGKKRNSTIVAPRQIAMYLCRKLTAHSLPEIAREFGGRDHGTVMHACNKIKKQIEKDISLQSIIQHIENELKQVV
ncbi:chromosomal replication initiator protein DnaA [Candidatus Desantisbacteria bacterium CG23_combo_of_CG06-09_8_20_14_all_40_23]|uniref:Chromosomal replication initiator protein DnaA n=1 Tax=Candidatus Desantisbacteria bacterium CG23_combo_of_CG06-09_8_20_14_all_40_23 TaxID=1974550 RepID=A0A2H0A8H3_9BACT|nr:MAG: chromosomal replication initiator protein DnaA [Candidatus Desantisbacteria bacterium CG23_combo_of_CG06-09_8_20_14_all_40_23]